MIFTYCSYDVQHVLLMIFQFIVRFGICAMPTPNMYTILMSLLVRMGERWLWQGHKNGEVKQCQKIVLNLVDGLNGRGHDIAMDNFVTSIEFLTKLEENDIYGTCTIRANRVGLPKSITIIKQFGKIPQGSMEWKMHESRCMCVVIWMDKKPVLLLSTHQHPITNWWGGGKCA